MLNVQKEGNKAIIDVRANILAGEHPRNEIIEYVKEAQAGTVFEIHLPKRAEPLVNALTSLGMNAIISELEPGHFRIMAVKIS
ncbi:amino acid decarboxylase [Bacillus sp. Marseille-P3661]|uniref:amino acid decarboxylase n=1 Tax=Bacillus sp. Marseille-P3661 TaxID=1936234 RepID=UPI000C830424|nr:amino acid decarboxylase [Bacillus sp. Marseille-P3661]